MNSRNQIVLDLETSAFKRDVERIRGNYDTLYNLERKLNFFLDTPNAEKYFNLK